MPMSLTAHARWGSFFYADERLAPMLDLTTGIDPAGHQIIRDVIDRCRQGDFDDGDAPARLHGDLWSGNVMWTDAGPVLIDPAAHGATAKPTWRCWGCSAVRIWSASTTAITACIRFVRAGAIALPCPASALPAAGACGVVRRRLCRSDGARRPGSAGTQLKASQAGSARSRESHSTAIVSHEPLGTPAPAHMPPVSRRSTIADEPPPSSRIAVSLPRPRNRSWI